VLRSSKACVKGRSLSANKAEVKAYMEPLIRCDNLVKIYSHSGVEVVALQGLDLSVQAGEIVGIVGASGSGKSTLLNVLGGLDRPSAGTLRVGERDLFKLSDGELNGYRRSQVGFVWQQTSRNLIPYLTALENVELPMRLCNQSRSNRRQRAMQLLEILELSHRKDHIPAMLSGGEQQRIAIAVALANRPQILLADEPTGEVDSATAAEVYTALHRINQMYGMTILIVSHDPCLGQYADRIVVICDGKASTETVPSGRQEAMEGPQATSAAPAIPPRERKTQEFEELVVLDSAGRLQIPRNYLEALDIGDRLRLELKRGHILIRPVSGRGRASVPQEPKPSPEELYLPPDQVPERTGDPWLAGARRLVGRIHFPNSDRDHE
jgi:putative ABC transport system ATP-binding protein